MNKKDMRILFVSLLLCFFASLLLTLPVYSHGEDLPFKIQYREVKLSESDIKTLGIETKKIKEEIISQKIQATGHIEAIPGYYFDINSPVQGIVKSIFVNLSEQVESGQPLALIKSSEIIKLKSELNQFQAELELRKSNYEREKALYEKGISSKKDFEAAKAILESTDAKLNQAKNNLKLIYGETNSLNEGEFSLVAPRAGVVVEINPTIGQVVGPSQFLFKVIDLSNVWINADIYEQNLHKMMVGQKVKLVSDTLEDEMLEGEIVSINSVVNKETRTIPVKAHFKNKKSLSSDQFLLQPGGFVQVEIETGKSIKSIIIPRTALTEIDLEGVEGEHDHIVYIQRWTPTFVGARVDPHFRGGKDQKSEFVPRKIIVEEHDSNNVRVISGLMAQETIVIQGAYQLQYEEGEDEHKSKKQFQLLPLIVVGFGLLVIIMFLYFRKKKTG